VTFPSLDQLIYQLIAAGLVLLVGFPVHEFAHAWAAYVQGDATAKMFGRLTLNPAVHLDKMGSILLLVSAAAGWVIGWAKPTPYNAANLRNRRNGEVLVALAGPAANMIVAAIAGLVVRLIVALSLPVPIPVGIILILFIQYQVILAIFNLLPIPPLDGSALLMRFLSPRQAWEVRGMIAQYGFVVLIVIVVVLGPFLSRIVALVTNALIGANVLVGR
jgi:Zn-dependent protease